jgi:DNA-binding MarR family transcriptional regulator
MTRATRSQAARELDSTVSSLATVRILHFASAGPVTAAGIAERLGHHGTSSSPAQLLARMTCNGLLKSATAPRARAYSLTPKGRRLLATAKDHLRQLAKSDMADIDKGKKTPGQTAAESDDDDDKK